MYLEGIFIGGDIRAQLPEEAAKFDTIDVQFRDVSCIRKSITTNTHRQKIEQGKGSIQGKPITFCFDTIFSFFFIISAMDTRRISLFYIIFLSAFFVDFSSNFFPFFLFNFLYLQNALNFSSSSQFQISDNEKLCRKFKSN